MHRFLATIIFVFSLASVAAHAGQGDWQVVKASQQVTYTLDKQSWQSVRVGDTVPNAAWVSTGPKGRVQLARGAESLIFQPNTLAGLFTSGFIETKTEIVQRTGVLDLEIEKRGRPHTTVQTPFLAAVVKGTNFRVTVSKSAANVGVNRGLVQVTSFQTGQRTNVGAGQRASVDSVKGMTVSGVVSKPTVTSVAPSAAKVAPIGNQLNGSRAATSGNKSTSSGVSKGGLGATNGQGKNSRGDDGKSGGVGNSKGSNGSNDHGGGNGNGGGGGKGGDNSG
ncbi:FecR domain-containing protein, partial [Neorhizobium sp. T25_13]|uniref:FecR domain-containing protein n=1 Tax=Neorhizobium sp. T25_13 TaxID=2093830 RepID=UPI000CF8A10D